MNFIFNDNVRIMCLSCNVKKVGKLVRFKQKGQKQASFLAFHKCCQGCLLRGPRYISTSFILVCALRCTYLQDSLFAGWKVYSSSTNKAKFIRIAYLYSRIKGGLLMVLWANVLDQYILLSKQMDQTQFVFNLISSSLKCASCWI